MRATLVYIFGELLGLISDVDDVYGFQVTDIASVDIFFYVSLNRTIVETYESGQAFVDMIIDELVGYTTSGSLTQWLEMSVDAHEANPSLSTVDENITVANVRNYTQLHDYGVTSEPTVMTAVPSTVPTPEPSPLLLAERSTRLFAAQWPPLRRAWAQKAPVPTRQDPWRSSYDHRLHHLHRRWPRHQNQERQHNLLLRAARRLFDRVSN